MPRLTGIGPKRPNKSKPSIKPTKFTKPSQRKPPKKKQKVEEAEEEKKGSHFTLVKNSIFRLL